MPAPKELNSVQTSASRGTTSGGDEYSNPQPFYDFSSLEEVREALARAGLESPNLIIGIDFTRSNGWTGTESFNGRSLHHIGDSLNPYQQVISIIGKTLAAHDKENLIRCYGFGDESTKDKEVFTLHPYEKSCNGVEGVLSRYRETVPHVVLGGPKSFAPVIEMAMTIVEQKCDEYHVLVIIAGGQLSGLERRTVEAIVRASKFPLSIILVGVGDGPWDKMEEFDDNIPARAFHNFKFVNFTDITKNYVHEYEKETKFALAALMEIPSRYKETRELNILGGRNGNAPQRFPLPPPGAPSFMQSSPGVHSNYPSSPPSSPRPCSPGSPVGTAPSGTSSTYDNQICPICFDMPKDMAFSCGHQTCCGCGSRLNNCPICRAPIQFRIKLHG